MLYNWGKKLSLRIWEIILHPIVYFFMLYLFKILINSINWYIFCFCYLIGQSWILIVNYQGNTCMVVPWFVPYLWGHYHHTIQRSRFYFHDYLTINIFFHEMHKYRNLTITLNVHITPWGRIEWTGYVIVNINHHHRIKRLKRGYIIPKVIYVKKVALYRSKFGKAKLLYILGNFCTSYN